MLLRRVIAHVRRQEWTAIGIDLGFPRQCHPVGAKDFTCD